MVFWNIKWPVLFIMVLQTTLAKSSCLAPYCLHCSHSLDTHNSCDVCAESLRVAKSDMTGFTCQAKSQSSKKTYTDNCQVFQLLDNGESDSEKCHICNYGFFQSAGKCAKNSIENCLIEIMDYPRGQICTLCTKGYFFNEDTKTCSAIETEDSISNCMFYKVHKQEKNHQKKNSKKEKFKREIFCLVCEQGFSLSKKSKQSQKDNSQKYVTCLKTEKTNKVDQCEAGQVKKDECLQCNYLSGWVSVNSLHSKSGYDYQQCEYAKSSDIRNLYQKVIEEQQNQKKKEPEEEEKEIKTDRTPFIPIRTLLIIVTIFMSMTVCGLMIISVHLVQKIAKSKQVKNKEVLNMVLNNSGENDEEIYDRF